MVQQIQRLRNLILTNHLNGSLFLSTKIVVLCVCVCACILPKIAILNIDKEDGCTMSCSLIKLPFKIQFPHSLLYNRYRVFLGGKYGRGVLLTNQPLLVPQTWKSRAIILPTLWATTRPVTGKIYLYLYHSISKSVVFNSIIHFKVNFRLGYR